MPEKQKQEKPSGARRIERQESPRIESYSSPKTRHTDENAGIIFSAFIFVASFIVVTVAGYAINDGIDIWVLSAAIIIAVLMVFVIHIAPQWERAVILRFGKYSRTVGPGLYLTIPFIEHIALRADQRIMLTGFGAEETLTADLVPVNVDAVIFWVVWDAEKACMEVEDYYDSVSLAAQTALRDAIGRKTIAEVAMHRVQLDEELRTAIEDKTSPWGISILFVEIRDIVIPKDLQDDMAAEAKAEREKDARIVLAEVESDIASMLLEATKIYREDELAFRLRSMHLLSEGVKGSQGTIVIPSAYAEGFTEEALKAAQPPKAHK
ncbi:MAG: slipin family protein [Coriobacteriales bacterium]|jgi:regulator of protease activity HflC (stomatin/prohibitin superfamily)|nr:slipin family protein [Coriobacteriales bacterium]